MDIISNITEILVHYMCFNLSCNFHDRIFNLTRNDRFFFQNQNFSYIRYNNLTCFGVGHVMTFTKVYRCGIYEIIGGGGGERLSKEEILPLCPVAVTD